MAISINEVTLMGYVGNDLKEIKNGVQFSVATNTSWTDKKTGEVVERTDWHQIIVFGKKIEYIKSIIKKGSKVYVKGELQNNNWTNENGVTQYNYQILAEKVLNLNDKVSDTKTVQE